MDGRQLFDIFFIVVIAIVVARFLSRRQQAEERRRNAPPDDAGTARATPVEPVDDAATTTERIGDRADVDAVPDDTPDGVPPRDTDRSGG